MCAGAGAAPSRRVRRPVLVLPTHILRVQPAVGLLASALLRHGAPRSLQTTVGRIYTGSEYAGWPESTLAAGRHAGRVAWGAITEFCAPSCITSILPVVLATRPCTSDMQGEERSPPVRLLYADELGQLKGDSKPASKLTQAAIADMHAAQAAHCRRRRRLPPPARSGPDGRWHAAGDRGRGCHLVRLCSSLDWVCAQHGLHLQVL